MTHKHVQGELLTQFFVAQINRDQTEGRGGMIDYGTFTDHMDAYNKTKGQAVMGCGDGDIVKRTYYRCTECPELIKMDERIYVGDDYAKKHIMGSGNYKDFASDGWRKDYSPLIDDPEYAEYVRLKMKFEK